MLRPQAADWDAGSGNQSLQTVAFGTTDVAHRRNGVDLELAQSDHGRIHGKGAQNGIDWEQTSVDPGRPDVHRNDCHPHHRGLGREERGRPDVHRDVIPLNLSGRKTRGGTRRCFRRDDRQKELCWEADYWEADYWEAGRWEAGRVVNGSSKTDHLKDEHLKDDRWMNGFLNSDRWTTGH